MTLDAKSILETTDLPTETVKVPEWGDGESLTVATITGTDRDAWEKTITNAEGTVTAENIRAKLLVRCIVNADGSRVFTDEQADALGKKSAKVLARLYNVASRLNGLSKDDVDELRKN